MVTFSGRDEKFRVGVGEFGDDLFGAGGVEEGKLFVSYGDPPIFYPVAVKEELERKRFDMLFERLEKLLEKKEDASALKDKEWKVTLERALMMQRQEFNEKISSLRNEMNDKYHECKKDIKEADTTSKLLSQKYDFFKDNNDQRIQNVQYSVVKTMGGVVTFIGGIAVTYAKLKDQISEFKVIKCIKGWLD